MNNYNRLTYKNRVLIENLFNKGNSITAIAKEIGVHKSTISRELKRGSNSSGKYEADQATKKSEIRIKTRYKNVYKKYPEFISYLEKKYNKRTFTIKTCAHFFKLDNKYAKSISFQQVYNIINQNKISIKKHSMTHKRRKKKLANRYRTKIAWVKANKIVQPIYLRPNHINDRSEYGHWEIDAVIGKKEDDSILITLNERQTRHVEMFKVSSKNSASLHWALNKYITNKGLHIKSITSDNGTEFSLLGWTAKAHNFIVYKCDPYASWQRGSNENINKIVRRFIPKGQPIKFISQHKIDHIQNEINNMPREMFGYKSANDLYNVHDYIAKIESNLYRY